MDYVSAKFGDFSFSRFGFIAQTDRLILTRQTSEELYSVL